MKQNDFGGTVAGWNLASNAGIPQTLIHLAGKQIQVRGLSP
jgi:hypothetical protein